MKKLLIIFTVVASLLVVTNSVSAQKRTVIADGYTLVTYGNISVIEDEVNQRTIRLEVTQQTTDTGQKVYDVLCANRTVKAVAIGGLSSGIRTALGFAGIPLPGWVVTPVVAYIYEETCAYFDE